MLFQILILDFQLSHCLPSSRWCAYKYWDPSLFLSYSDLKYLPICWSCGIIYQYSPSLFLLLNLLFISRMKCRNLLLKIHFLIFSFHLLCSNLTAEYYQFFNRIFLIDSVKYLLIRYHSKMKIWGHLTKSLKVFKCICLHLP
jgi:hypothetical protein